MNPPGDLYNITIDRWAIKNHSYVELPEGTTIFQKFLNKCKNGNKCSTIISIFLEY